MKLPDTIQLEKRIFEVSATNFNNLAIDIFKFQYHFNTLYQKYCQLMHCNPALVTSIKQIPFLPISFFKTHCIKTTEFTEEVIFESSGTTSQESSKHFIKDVSIYQNTFLQGFISTFGNPTNYCILALLPSYLQKGNSSLVFMANDLIKQSNNIHSGFYLEDYEKLHQTILSNEIKKIPTILLGVTYALIDFANAFPMQLQYTYVIETGGMKGRKKEIIRQEVHELLKKQLGLSAIYSEYGMTELLSQAYSSENGIFKPTATMQLLIRDDSDPLELYYKKDITTLYKTGALNIIDLGNLYSCSFIATDDVGKLYGDGNFEVLGRLDNSDIRGCSLLTI